MQHHINRTVSTHNLVGTAKNFYTPHRKNKIFHTTTTILIWHFLRYASKTSTVMQQLDQVSRIFLIIYNRIGQRRVTQKGPNGYFIGRWFWLAQSVKSHPQLGVVGLLLCLHLCIAARNNNKMIVIVRWDNNSNCIKRLQRRQKWGRGNDIFG